MDPQPHMTSDDTKGLWFGLIGVILFGLTLPMTRIAVADLDPVFIALGRSLVAGSLAVSTVARRYWLRCCRWS